MTQAAKLSVSHVQAGYGDVQVLWDISLEVAAGELVCLIGSNGAGKTTFLRCVSGILPVTAEITQDWGRLNARPDRPPVVDGLMAATALVHRLTLVTRNVGDVASTGVGVLNRSLRACPDRVPAPVKATCAGVPPELRAEWPTDHTGVSGGRLSRLGPASFVLVFSGSGRCRDRRSATPLPLSRHQRSHGMATA